jgi:hypothetical protein
MASPTLRDAVRLCLEAAAAQQEGDQIKIKELKPDAVTAAE